MTKNEKWYAEFKFRKRMRKSCHILSLVVLIRFGEVAS
jgi:hypothetical protein